MPFSIVSALQEGVERVFSRTGATFAVLLFVLGTLNAMFSATLLADFMRGPFGSGRDMVPTVGLSAPIAGLLTLVVVLLSTVVGVAALRAFVDDVDRPVESSLFTRNIGWAVLNLIVGGIVFGLIVALGFILLVIPGIFLLVSLVFWSVFVAVEDVNFVEGLRQSWALTGGHRIRLFGLGLATLIIVGVVSGLFTLPAQVGGPGIGALVVTQIGSAVTSVFSSATLARAWVQLRELAAEDEQSMPTEVPAEQ